MHHYLNNIQKPGPLEDGLEEEEEECVSEENELLAKDEFSVEENFTAEFESENMNCDDIEYFCNKGANLWSASGYSMKMTDSSHLLPPPIPTEPDSLYPPVFRRSLPQVALLSLAHGSLKFDFLMNSQCFECLPRSSFKGKIV
ncbi:hypothetical protein GOODEAATRI_002747 [Goodea atripinnis]|uniref:Uncharacterized protein n=1 Tax=Goodea atripinnis TaxID=208336 RepID=A0ABV0MEK8_9TELE